MSSQGDDKATRRRIVEACRQFYSHGLIAGADGNVSVRMPGRNLIYTTPGGLHKGTLTEDDIVGVDASGRRVAGERRPSSELALHLGIYAGDPQAMAVVHTHAPWTLALYLSGQGLQPHLLTEARALLGEVPLVPYCEPGTPDLANAVASVLGSGPVQVLAHHGAVARGKSLDEAIILMECLEHSSKITALARLLGQPAPLPFLD